MSRRTDEDTTALRVVATPAASPASGRERHDEKITVYCSADELMELERARLGLRGDFGIAVDRGRIVREALSILLEDLETKGGESSIVRRLHRG